MTQFRITPRRTAPRGTALPALLAASLLLAPAAALAGDKGKHGGKHDDWGRYEVAQGCPPGLAKKHNGCQPPGQARKAPPYRAGDRITHDYVVIRDPRRYGLDPRYTYWSSDDYVFRVNRETGEILNLIGAVAAVLD